MESIWKEETKKEIEHELFADTVVVGSGLAGVLTAYFLQESGREVVVIESETYETIQKHCPEKDMLTMQPNLKYANLLARYGKTRVKQYVAQNEEAIRQYERVIQKEQISCRLAWLPSFIYASSREGALQLEEEQRAAQKLGIEVQWEDDLERISEVLPFPVHALLAYPKQAQFQAGVFLEAISKKVRLRHDVFATSIEENQLETNHGVLQANHVIFAVSHPYIQVPGYYYLRMPQERSYQIAFEKEARFCGMFQGMEESSLEIRMVDDLIFVSGGSHKEGEYMNGEKLEWIRQQVKHYWPECNEVKHWSKVDHSSMNMLPYIGQFSTAHPQWNVVAGFGKWDIGNSMIAALELVNRYFKN